MQRRHFLQLSSIAASAGSFGSVFAAIPAATANWRQFEVTTFVDLSEKTAQSKVWIPVPAAELPGYQRTVDVSFNAPGNSQTAKIGQTKDTQVGNKYTLTVGGGDGAAGGGGGAAPGMAMNIVAPSEGSGGGAGGSSQSSITMEPDSIKFNVGKSTMTMKADGTIQIDGKDISVLASNKLLEDAKEGVQITGGPSVAVNAKVIDLN